ncbi:MULTISPECIES: molecular chaperone [unclassified Serratia (in: enterobacteria)]|uniref:fimbrial biogenesis chaperone n=1 Tax=unclassified Serratia (in: enterobacteria) TaxID=2647522 RepID=UPI0005013795|nr:MULTISPECIES: molecular chaperone [unclassified Serratia (in: enterobacteria)]KFK95434.1 long polar fimbrial chaperone LpfB [Serratia sp. Ag2]KFK98782.1 long polar fimbrial chaperone LpfB [Serratia sp. Ag1]
MKLWHKALLGGLLLASLNASAGVIVGGTRVIYDGGKKEAALSVKNPDKTAYLMQSWVETQDNGQTKVPFVITPPLFRLNGGQDNMLRIVRAGGNLPEDKESLFWLNVKSIPSAEKVDNTLQIAVKTRIKLIYRPAGISGSLNDAAKNLKWQRNGNTLQAINHSPYYLSFFSITLGGKELPEVTMVAPNATVNYTLPTGAAGNTVSWKIINDYGGTSDAFQFSL